MHSLSLLVVDISVSWEEELKAQERGYFIDWNPWKGLYAVADWWKPERKGCDPIIYPYGSARAGLDAIIDTVRIAYGFKIPVYSVDKVDQWSDDDEDVCYSLLPYIPKENRYLKYGYSAFSCRELSGRLQRNAGKLLVIGYDRDFCVMETVKEAVSLGIQVVTSEHCMMTLDKHNKRESSLDYYRENTLYMESLPAVWNYIRKVALNS